MSELRNQPSLGVSIVFYDGVCGLCNGFVRFLLRRKPGPVYYFSPLQSDLAHDILEPHGADPHSLSAMFLVEHYGERRETISSRSKAAFRILHSLGGFWRLIALLDILPRPFLDACYELIARVRYKLFGKYETCPVPEPRHRHLFLALVGTVLLSTLGGTTLTAQDQPVGYEDTPQLPGQAWKVHDPNRPQPQVVASSERFSELATPPGDATVLFDGTDLSHWQTADGGEPGWKVENGYMEVVSRSGSILTREEFGDFQLHVEFATPAKVESNSQGRGNSGVIIYGRYEVQILDSWQNPTYPDGQAGSLYGQYPPLVNASRPPGEWQTYDIFFEGPRFEGGELSRPASVTVIHNGVLVQHKKKYIGATFHRRVGEYSAHPPQGRILLQDHSNPTRFRNIWIRAIGAYDEG